MELTDRKKKILRAVIAFALFVLILAPWVIRNARIGSGWRLDEVSADSLRHNASVVESRVNGIPAQFYREQYAITFEKEFSDRKKYPDRDACLSYEERYLSAILLRHPGTYFLLFFNPSKLVPDVPTFLENLKLTTGGRGTWDVIIKDGLFAGIRHYFAGKLHLPFLLTPLILLLLATYAGAFCEVLFALAGKKWLVVLLFLLFCVYYLMVVGPGGYPRFQLPALPFRFLTGAAPAREARESNASTDNQLSMPQLHRAAALLRRFRQTGVRVLRRQLRPGGDRGALCREGRKGGRRPAGGGGGPGSAGPAVRR